MNKFTPQQASKIANDRANEKNENKRNTCIKTLQESIIDAWCPVLKGSCIDEGRLVSRLKKENNISHNDAMCFVESITHTMRRDGWEVEYNRPAYDHNGYHPDRTPFWYFGESK